ncbi:MAG: hypothetical protein BECKG1743E_GA0114224_104975, partial [Candidatus Kentron sp. G]
YLFIGNSDRLFRSIGCGSLRWVSNNDYCLRVEYGARESCSLSECTARRAYSTLQGAANFLACSDTPLPSTKSLPDLGNREKVRNRGHFFANQEANSKPSFLQKRAWKKRSSLFTSNS